MKAFKERVVVGVSGGVDSSVALMIVKKSGYDVIGVYMNNWKASFEGLEDLACAQVHDIEDARKVCLSLKVPFHVVDLSTYYKKSVFDASVEKMKLGETPNPDVLCNKLVKFDKFLKYAKLLGANKVVTGHYAGIKKVNDEYFLERGVDKTKDQSYFLYAVKKNVLKDVIFPLSSLLKKEVRAIAKENKLHVAGKKDSTGVCFVGERKFNSFISKYIEDKPGEIVDTEGNIVGHHKGLHFYTSGQRRGLGGGFKEPYFVLDKNVQNNRLVVTSNLCDTLASFCTVCDLNFLVDPKMIDWSTITCKVRYRADDINCSFNIRERTVSFNENAFSVTPGQSIVFYKEERCLGGALINKVMRST